MDISRVNLINEAISTVNSSRTNTPKEPEFSFKEMVNNEINKLNDKKIQADELVEDFIQGDVEDLHTVLIASDEASLALELAVQVRNRLVEAYKEINNMQI
ncbi:flagellar hook-basal body complex protein FliE [Paratissierella segnis]|jgi:flagellar hook-basal body complex protein FliE|uniref:Flagellar hook-basal body complex protein FliE n=1 Tax=Paratissierella segnis TaxID=2763679 RepID=A0A926EXY1_9FIRM|nr:flagellar hook-basal body complex protein FliE [Paratissierella segnis]MBC8588324.1 flagellar hook-basal body complex protein FliE [Paratissierella segnis]